MLNWETIGMGLMWGVGLIGAFLLGPFVLRARLFGWA